MRRGGREPGRQQRGTRPPTSQYGVEAAANLGRRSVGAHRSSLSAPGQHRDEPRPRPHWADSGAWSCARQGVSRHLTAMPTRRRDRVQRCDLDGNQADNSSGDSGAAYLARSGTAGASRPTSRPPTPAGDQFGISVAISGETVVGAPISRTATRQAWTGTKPTKSGTAWRSRATRCWLEPPWRTALRRAWTGTRPTTLGDSGRPTVGGAARPEPPGLPQGLQHGSWRQLRGHRRALGQHAGRVRPAGGQQRNGHRREPGRRAPGRGGAPESAAAHDLP